MSVNRTKRITVILALALTMLVTFGLPGCGRRVEPPAYNLLLITLDTTRADRLGLYGYDRPTSPNLDALATEAVVFDRAIAQAAVTPVSHASILTGLEPYHHGLRVMHGFVGNRLPDEQTTLAEIWRDAGGQTGAVVSAFPVTAAFGLDQGFELFDAAFLDPAGDVLVSDTGQVNTGLSQRRADATTDIAIDWLETSTARERPFFLWVHYFDPHDPFVAPPVELTERLTNGVFRPPTADRPDLMRSLYDAEVFYMDAHLGRLLDSIRVRGLWQRTIIVVVADHGEGLGDHDWWTHGILYQEQIRVPCMIRVPGLPGGSRVSSIVRTIDLLPTMLSAAAVDRALWPAMDGVSLLDAMRTGRTATPLRAYSESVNILDYARHDSSTVFDQKHDKLYALLEGDQKLIYHQLQPEKSELYDLAADPAELVDLAGPPRPAVMDSMLGRLESRQAFSPIMPGMTATDLERIERLKGLGYVQ